MYYLVCQVIFWLLITQRRHMVSTAVNVLTSLWPNLSIFQTFLPTTFDLASRQTLTLHN